MQKSDLQDGMIVEIEFECMPAERFIKLGNRFIGKGYVNLDDITDTLQLNSEISKSKITKIFKNKSMQDLDDINNDNKLELIWEREKEIDWSKVPKWTPVQVKDNSCTYFSDVDLFVSYESELKDYPFLAIREPKERNQVNSWRYCRIHPSVEIKKEWYK